MKYINAITILPDVLVEELQEYVQVGYIYIPAKDERHKSWGELSGCRKELYERNKIIMKKYKNNVLYHYPINRDKLVIGKFCSIACGAKLLKLKWWDWSQEKIAQNIKAIKSGHMEQLGY